MLKKTEILNDFQKQVLKEIGKSDLAKFFYWSGGTALAYGYFNHRYSEDLDFMSEELLPDEYFFSLIKNLQNNLGIEKTEQKKIYNRNEFIFYKKGQALKLEFIYYPFKNIKKTAILKEFSVKISSLHDIAVNKVHALYERSEPKDVFDLYFILQSVKLSLNQLLNLTEKKFGTQIDLALFSSRALKAAENLENIKPLIFEKSYYKKNKIKEYFVNAAKTYLKKKIK